MVATRSSDWSCPLLASGCRATVLALSACLNQVAAATPVSLCVRLPLCDRDAPDPPPLRKKSDLPPAPACAVLNGDCPVTDRLAGYLARPRFPGAFGPYRDI